MAYTTSSCLLIAVIIAVVSATIEQRPHPDGAPPDATPYGRPLGNTYWGHWGAMHKCNGSFVDGFRLKVQSYRGVFGDDSAVNAISFHCGDGEVFSSMIGQEGMWQEWKMCPGEGSVIDAVSLRSEYDQGDLRDDMAATDFAAHCTDGSWVFGESGLDRWGSWDTFYCVDDYPSGRNKVCGMQTQVDRSVFDRTGLNRIYVECC